MKRVLEIKFNNCNTKVELLDTPAVEKWINIYSQYAKEFLSKGIPISHKIEEARAFIHTAPRNIGHKFVTKAAQEKNKVHSSLGVTEDLTSNFDSAEVIQDVSKILGGKGGGGRKDMAQAGGISLENIDQAMDRIKTNLRS